MNIINTDSLGLEILNSISLDETQTDIKVYKTKDEAIESKELETITLFQVTENEKVISYFVLDTKTYTNWIEDYKIKGVEI